MKQKILKIINPLLMSVFLGLVATAILHDLIPYTVYRVVHPLLGYLFAGLAVSHVSLNWAWIKNNFFK